MGDNEANIPLARPWSSTLPGQWLALMRAWTRDHHPIHFVRLLQHPCTSVDRSIAMSDSVSALLAKLPPKLVDAVVLQDRATRCGIDVDNTTILLEWFDALNGPRERSFDACCEWWLQYFASQMDALASLASSPLEITAWSGITEAAKTLLSLPRPLMIKASWSWPDFVDALFTLADGTAVRDTGEPLAGLQILSLTESRYVPVEHAIIMGCAEGTFPHSLPRDSLVDNKMKEVMGLPAWQHFESLEDTTFHLLMGRIPNVELTWPLQRGEDHQVRSRWIEQMVAAGQKVNTHDHSHLYALLDSKQKVVLPDPKALEGITPDLDRLLGRVSASSLQKLMQCPYSFLLHARGIRPLDMPQEDDHSLTGTLLHKVLELFFDPKSVASALDGTWRTEFTSGDDFISWAIGRLRQLTIQVLPQALIATPAIQQIWYRGWPALAEQWQILSKEGWQLDHAMTEHRIGANPDQPVILQVGERMISVTGAMDLLLPGPANSYLLVDYKSSSTPSAREIQKGVAPQLILYALCLTQDNAGKWQTVKGITG